MAALSSLTQFVDVFGKLDPSQHPHVWLAEGGKLVVGSFPIANLAYDFATECLEIVDSRYPTPKTKKRESLIHLARRVGSDRYEIETPEAVYELGSATQALCWGLEHIEREVPGTLDKLSGQKGRSKRPVAKRLEDLYDMPSQRKHAEQISTGHFVATNNKALEAIGYLRSAARLAKLSQDQFIVRRRAA